MSRNDEWTEAEKGRLQGLYSSEIDFDEIAEAFPNRTSNAIRMKASRLGFRRPIIPSMSSQQTMLLCVEGNGRSNGFVLRCGECGNWVHLKDSNHGVCGVCGAACQVIP